MDKADILLAMGNCRGAFEMLETGKQAFDNFIWPPQLEAPEVDMHLLSGDIDFANRWFQKKQFHPSKKVEYFQLGEYFVFARLLVAQSRYEEARKLLDELRMIAESAGANYWLIKSPGITSRYMPRLEPTPGGAGCPETSCNTW